MKSGRNFLKKIIRCTFTIMTFVAVICFGLSTAEANSRHWYDKDGIFHEELRSLAYDMDENGLRRDKQVEHIIHTWYDREGNQHEITKTPSGTRQNTIPASLSAKSRIRYWYDEKGLLNKEYTFYTPGGEKDIEHVWYEKDGRSYEKEYGYVVLNGKSVYRESASRYDEKGCKHIDIFWIYPDNQRHEKHIWFDEKQVRHEEWIK